ncbi:glutamyl-tRNA reductase [Corynebacterium uterequi]|uniref:Glutamyl-tRNA reductase n=2 Tax=Corynebacterium uterequi TaxID=1072256 RepID=A0A0G3HGL6_9CORY|nr:glutamyl-tRNA reductase [Corynebacterium uterequi]
MADDVRGGAVAKLMERSSLQEAMIVSTCNRLEVYTVTNAFHAGVSDVVAVLNEISGIDPDTLRSYLYVRYADAAAEHMMVVTSGLDSMVVGEQQIIGQVRNAYREASGAGTVGPHLHSLSQTALRTGKRVHAETGIDDAGGSMVTFALDEALRRAGRASFAGMRALVLGAGAMASLAATQLGKHGVAELVVANRTVERAERLASHAREAGVAARAIAFADRREALDGVDVVVSATGADGFTIDAADVPAERGGRGLILVDLSLPRDIDDALSEVPGVTLVNIESMHHSVTSRDSTSEAHKRAQAIVSEELQAYASEQRVRDVAPAVAALRQAANNVAESELGRLRPKLDDDAFAEVSRTVHRVVDKLLHVPTVQAKKLAAESATITYETALQQLFGLEPTPSPSVAVAADQLPSTDADRIIPPHRARA